MIDRPPTLATRRRSGLLLLGLAAAIAGCTVSSGPGTERVRGILALGSAEEAAQAAEGAAQAAEPGGGDAAQTTSGSLEVPDTVRVDETFSATVRTVGMNGCWSAAGEEVSAEGLTATIVPFDSTGEREGVACTMALVSLVHDVELAFRRPGEATVRVEGRRVLDRGGRESEPMSLEATVAVVR